MWEWASEDGSLFRGGAEKKKVKKERPQCSRRSVPLPPRCPSYFTGARHSRVLALLAAAAAAPRPGYCWQAQDFLRLSVGSVGAIVMGMLSREGDGSLSPSLLICFCDTMW